VDRIADNSEASPAGDASTAAQASARLFRSIRAGRSWVRAQETRETVAATGGCVLMKPGQGAPLFMIPGAPGSILQLAPLAEALTAPEPIYAIKPRGLEEGETPCGSIAELAAYGIAALRQVRPHGPYRLVGYSAGGLVALEMAQQLTAAGEGVPLIVLLDTLPSRRIWPWRCHADILARQCLRVVADVARISRSPSGAEIKRRWRSLLEYLGASGVKRLPRPPVVPEGTNAASRRVHVATYNAGEAYRPRRYAGKVVYVQPEEVPNLEPRAPRQVWGSLLPDLEVRRVPGSHLGMLDEGVVGTAAALDACLAGLPHSSRHSRESEGPGAAIRPRPALPLARE